MQVFSCNQKRAQEAFRARPFHYYRACLPPSLTRSATSTCRYSVKRLRACNSRRALISQMTMRRTFGKFSDLERGTTWRLLGEVSLGLLVLSVEGSSGIWLFRVHMVYGIIPCLTNVSGSVHLVYHVWLTHLEPLI
ncbi:hypothetical protein PanWU01x14_119710 [Parasponia andersonii]|uniref:Uncharacterized protein n=1 Tax=Parasponia andersonii TaxID=3476 RepID=A0A2P5CVG5_PARAD|nr:hypothetical protein PanWU01x14_119710 [Parasponia andersonii]